MKHIYETQVFPRDAPMPTHAQGKPGELCHTCEIQWIVHVKTNTSTTI